MAKRVLADLRPNWATSAETKRIIDAESQTLARNWLSDKGGQLLVGIAGRDALQASIREWSDDDYFLRAIKCLEKNADYDPGKAFALVNEPKAEVECWMIGSEEDYRAIYHDFLTQFFGLAADLKIASRFHIDHVLARSRADEMFSNERDYYLRLTIARSQPNVDAGRVYEKFASERDLKPDKNFGCVVFNFPLAMKAFNLPSPKDQNYGDDYVVCACRSMVDKGILPASELDTPYAIIRNVFMRSSKRPAVDNAISIISGNHVLTMCSPLLDWLDHYPRGVGTDSAGCAPDLTE